MADEPRTVRHVAQQLGLSRQRVQQLRDRALSVLADHGGHMNWSPNSMGPDEAMRVHPIGPQ